MDRLMRGSRAARSAGGARTAEAGARRGSSTAARRPRRRDAAFTLLETFIALLILGFGILTVAGVLLTTMQFSRQSRSKMQAMYLAQQQIEAFRAMSAQDVLDLTAAAGYPNDPNNPLDPDPGDGDQTQFNRRWLIQADTPESGVASVTIEVDWVDDLGTTRTIALHTMKASF